MKAWIAVIPIVVAATIVAAAEQRVELKAGAGRDKVEANCVACHSLDYIVGNSPFMNLTGVWAEVQMIKAHRSACSWRRQGRSSTTSLRTTARHSAVAFGSARRRARRRRGAATIVVAPPADASSPGLLQHAATPCCGCGRR